MTKRVEIYGAGISGLVAAIQLARQGFEVHLFDREERIGGNQIWHPSIQTTNLNLDKTSQYIEIELKNLFHPINNIIFYRYGRRSTFSLPDMYACERGPREKSLDFALGKLASDVGVIFHPGVEFSKRLSSHNASTIVATGLNIESYQELGIPYVLIKGYRALTKTNLNSILFTYMSKCTNYDFAYIAATNELLFCLLFSRGMISDRNLSQLKILLKDTEKIEFNNWEYSHGALPKEPHLFWGDWILTGTLSGMIDPYLLHGISGAMISGKIAALAVSDPSKAEVEFQWFSKNFLIKKCLKSVSSRLPLKRFFVPAMMWVDNHLQGVGFVK